MVHLHSAGGALCRALAGEAYLAARAAARQSRDRAWSGRMQQSLQQRVTGLDHTTKLRGVRLGISLSALPEVRSYPAHANGA
jgi:hypothetical protein